MALILGTSAAIVADRVRAYTILASVEAKRNLSLAIDLATARGMDAPTALAILRGSPAAETPYEAAMRLHGGVPVPGVDEVAAGGGVIDGATARLDRVKASARDYNVRMGYADREPARV